MPIHRHIVTLVTVLLMLPVLLRLLPVGEAQAQQKPMRIGAHVYLDDWWAKHATPENRDFVTILKAHTKSGRIEALPNDRLYRQYQNRKLDCILTGGWPHDDPQLRSQRALTFEVRLFTLSDKDLSTQEEILVGRMKQFPPPSLPLERTMVDWFPLQNLPQGFDLLRAGRIDALIADPSHVLNAPDNIHHDIIPADLPPLKTVHVPLICHDTKHNRNFVEMLDRGSLMESSRLQ